ncbi:retinol-binding protein pinta [Musca domestica]|uniref:Retinol-binding protein pinta n=1 Tax=Musca domestica TaxID=7370 RepID=A0ABM3VCU1_MUSDO|nr:retinol-binding protein pinta [Musca domestica]
MENQMKLQIEPLPEELQKVAIEELGEVPERMAEDLQIFKEWIKKQIHLRARMDDQFLIQFLRGCKYSLEKAKKKIDTFYAMKTKYPEYFNLTNVDDPLFRKLHSTGFYIPLPTPLNDHGPRIIMCRFQDTPNAFPPNNFFQYCNSRVEIMLMNDPYACINGIMLICDFAKASPSHLLPFTVNIIKQNAMFSEKAFPMRFKTFCMINIASYAQQFFNHTSEKFRNKFILCGTNSAQWAKQLPVEYMPIDYGGKNGSISELCQEYDKLWDEYRDYFKDNANYGTDEHLRLGEPFNFDDDFGTGGTLRKLNVD